MRLVLCSEGFVTENTIQACVELCGKPQEQISVAVINEAYAVQTGDMRWVIDALSIVASKFPAEIDLINLLALDSSEIERRIADKDVIFVIGGNPDYLMQTFEKSGFVDVLPTLLKEKVYVGSSAGSMVLGHRLPSETIYTLYKEPSYGNVEKYLGLVDLAVLPHLEREDFPSATKEMMNKQVPETNHDVYGLRDDSAIVINEETLKFIGSEPHKVLSD